MRGCIKLDGTSGATDRRRHGHVTAAAHHGLAALLSELLERIHHTLTVECRCVDDWDVSVVASPGFNFVSWYLLLEVLLVANDQEGKLVGIRRGSVGDEVLLPFVKLSEGGSIVSIKHQQASVGATIEGIADGLKALLASSIPHLQLYSRSVDADLLLEELSADGAACGWLVGTVVHERADQRGLADPHIAENDYFAEGLLGGVSSVDH